MGLDRIRTILLHLTVFSHVIESYMGSVIFLVSNAFELVLLFLKGNCVFSAFLSNRAALL